MNLRLLKEQIEILRYEMSTDDDVNNDLYCQICNIDNDLYDIMGD